MQLAKLFINSVSVMPTIMRRALCVLSLAALGASACAVHDAEPAFRATVLIDGRGISIPLPPPSLTAEPQQEVELEGEVIGLDEDGDGLVVRVLEDIGGTDKDVPLAADDSTFVVQGVNLDLTDNCLEVWLEGDDGRQGEHRFYQAVIDESDESVSIVEGCE